MLEGLAKDSVHMLVGLMLQQHGKRVAANKFHATKEFRAAELLLLTRCVRETGVECTVVTVLYK